MRTIFELGVATSVALMIASCSESTPATDTTANDVTTYADLTTNAEAAATSYETSMMQSGVTTASCEDIHDAYDAHVRPMIAQMMHMSGAMDDVMEQHGGHSATDMACTAAAMMAELDHHRGVACTFSDVASDQSEAQRHVGAMLTFCGHASDRCNEMRQGMGGGSWGWGSMMAGCQDFHADGGMPHDWDDGMMDHDGGQSHPGDGGMMH